MRQHNSVVSVGLLWCRRAGEMCNMKNRICCITVWLSRAWVWRHSFFHRGTHKHKHAALPARYPLSHIEAFNKHRPRLKWRALITSLIIGNARRDGGGLLAWWRRGTQGFGISSRLAMIPETWQNVIEKVYLLLQYFCFLLLHITFHYIYFY